MDMNKGKKQRYYIIDALRGLALLNMILYHFLYDIYVLYGRNPEWVQSLPVIVWERYICVSFILIAGVSASFSRNLVKRGLILNGWGIVITLVTVLVTPDSPIFFGVLNLMGCSLLILALVKRWINSSNWLVWGMGSLLLLFFFQPVKDGYLGFGTWQVFKLPLILYQWKWMIPFGLHGDAFFSADYFPILPWFFLFLAGYAMSFLMERLPKLQKILHYRLPVLTEAGQKSLIVYLLHQPVAMGLCMILFQ